jgi:hypothetical protein
MEPQDPAADPLPSPTDTQAPIVQGKGVVIRRNAEHNGIELKFPDKPDGAVLTWLKAKHFRWSRYSKIWYCKFNEAMFSEVTTRFAA